MKGEPINIILSANDAYHKYCAATIQSVLSSNQNVYLNFYIITTDFKAKTRDAFTKLFENLCATLEIITIDSDMFLNFPNLKHISNDSYSRLLAAELLPNINKFIYLDCDLTVEKPISELYETNLGDNIIGAVRQRNSEMHHSVIKRYKLPKNLLYINSGVLLVNAKAWRENLVTKGILKWIQTNLLHLEMSDQESLLVYLEGKILELNPKWNIEARHYSEKKMGMPLEKDLLDAMESPAVIHYTGSVKPWSSTGFVAKRFKFTKHFRSLPEELQPRQTKYRNSVFDYLKWLLAVSRFRIGALRST